MKTLVEAGAEVRTTDDHGFTCLHLAAAVGYTEIVRYLVGLPQVDVNCRDSGNVTALFIAARDNHTNIAQLLTGPQSGEAKGAPGLIAAMSSFTAMLSGRGGSFGGRGWKLNKVRVL